MEAFPHLRALFGGNLPPFSEWGTNPVILEADRRAREAASRPHNFSDLSTPHWNPGWPPHIRLMHSEMSGEDSLLKFDFWFRYPTKPLHPERVSESERFLRDQDKLRVQLVCSFAVFLIRRRRQVDIDADAAQAAARADAAAAETATYFASLAADDYLAAWLCLSAADVETLGITDMPPLAPASTPTLPDPGFGSWGDGTLSGLGPWGDDSASVGWPTPPPDDTQWGTGNGWGNGWGSTVAAGGTGWGTGWGSEPEEAPRARSRHFPPRGRGRKMGAIFRFSRRPPTALSPAECRARSRRRHRRCFLASVV
ncbi:hypothetical protein C8F04DRAFT_1188098 [Mycena alexandri]|uniref:Uncharacterized protein n=1 Tax=Mycena alexandri TaxID=1745969 RepID=A0AAD6SJ72_9AGAR|nr:hypothetical protein C8F04DRAFT_1188098 [Mycena alexandri]